MNKILVIDDDPSLVELIQYNLEGEGYSVVIARNGQDGLRTFFAERPALIILDIAMPKLDGYEVCRRVRELADTPIIMLTAKGREEDIIRGLDSGADDYLTKPFRIGELLARVRAALRRQRSEPTILPPATYSDDYLIVDLANHRVTVQGEPVKLTPTEYKLLSYLLQHKGRLLEFRQILEHVWGFEYINDIDYLRVYVLNELNTGYRFEGRR